MDLFLMRRYWSDDEEKTVEQQNEDILTKLNKKATLKRKISNVKEEEEGEEKPVVVVESLKPVKKAKKKKKNKVKNEDFTVLGEETFKVKAKVRRVLPNWLANPDIVSVDLSDERMPIDDIEDIDSFILEKLRSEGVRYLFPVQRQVIPWLLDSTLKTFYRPRDVCVSAPTGSGKTLAFVLPIVQALRSRVTPEIRALVILPVQDLAVQVYKVFQTYTEGSRIKVKLLASGQSKSFKDEQKELVRKGYSRYYSLVDILVATPGRLVDHIQKTEGFSLASLRYLVVDEADRVMEDVQNDWLRLVEAAVYKDRKASSSLINALNANKREIPLQKLLFSATFSQDPEKLQEMNLYEPKLFTSVNNEPKDMNEFIGRYTTPVELKEHYLIIEDPMKKPLVLKALLRSKEVKKVLIFVKSTESAHFLAVLLKQFGLSVGELSSQIEDKRNRIVNKFKDGKIEYLVCTDALARGMDIGRIDYVISYDCPKFIKTYIHRVGRTARAGISGSAVTFLNKSEIRKFNTMMKEGQSVITEMKISEINEEDLEKYEKAREAAAAVLSDENNLNKKKRKKMTQAKNKN